MSAYRQVDIDFSLLTCPAPVIVVASKSSHQVALGHSLVSHGNQAASDTVEISNSTSHGGRDDVVSQTMEEAAGAKSDTVVIPNSTSHVGRDEVVSQTMEDSQERGADSQSNDRRLGNIPKIWKDSQSNEVWEVPEDACPRHASSSVPIQCVPKAAGRRIKEERAQDGIAGSSGIHMASSSSSSVSISVQKDSQSNEVWKDPEDLEVRGADSQTMEDSQVRGAVSQTMEDSQVRGADSLSNDRRFGKIPKTWKDSQSNEVGKDPDDLEVRGADPHSNDLVESDPDVVAPSFSISCNIAQENVADIPEALPAPTAPLPAASSLSEMRVKKYCFRKTGWVALVHPFTASFLHRWLSYSSEAEKASAINWYFRLRSRLRFQGRDCVIPNIFPDFCDGQKWPAQTPQEVKQAKVEITHMSERWMEHNLRNYRELCADADRDIARGVRGDQCSY